MRCRGSVKEGVVDFVAGLVVVVCLAGVVSVVVLFVVVGVQAELDALRSGLGCR